MDRRTKIVLINILFGTLLGFTVSNIGFGDYGQLNRMFTFQDLRMLFAFIIGVALSVVGFAVLAGSRPTRTKVHKGIVPGGILFGTGWAISGGCPAIPIIQVAGGYLPALVTIGGVVVGMYACRSLNARYFHLDRGSCGL
ncbi:MAG: YeeE/YedE thiosulfate transporter family protein [Acidimicrobiia bacterium]